MTLVIPFISTYYQFLKVYTPFLAGLVVGIFGLTQAIFQISFGMLSDRFGNKILMLIALTQVMAALLIAYYATSMWWLIFVRTLQGIGAVIGVGYAWVAKLAVGKGRLKAMSILGTFISVTVSFALGHILRKFMSG